MRFRPNIGYVIGALLWLPYWVCVICEAQPPLTSDSRAAGVTPASIDPTSLPRRAPVYIPPRDDIFDVLVTNTRPIVVEVTVFSNEVRRTIWYKDGQARTNEQTLSTNMLSRTTNTVSIP